MQFPLDTTGILADRLADAPESAQLRYKNLEIEAREERAKTTSRLDEIKELDAQIENLTVRLHLAQREEQNTGPYRTERNETDPKTGGQITVVETTGYVATLERDLRTAKAKRKELAAKRSKRRSALAQVNADLGTNAHRPLVAASPIEWRPAAGEQIADGYAREFRALAALVKREDEIWNAPRPVARAIETVFAEIDRTAKGPENGGHRRGSVIGPRGREITTRPEIGWPMRTVASGSMLADTVPDTLAILCWLFRDQMKAAVKKQIMATYDDEGAISEADKRKLVAEIEQQIWDQRRVVEAAYCYARANGIKNLNRPRGTPSEILLDVLPWKKRGIVVPAADEALSMIEEPVEEPDFEFEE